MTHSIGDDPCPHEGDRITLRPLAREASENNGRYHTERASGNVGLRARSLGDNAKRIGQAFGHVLAETVRSFV